MICTYCGKDIKDLDNLKTLEYEEDKVLVCSDKCANDFRKYKKISERNRIKFLGLTILNSVIAIILYIIGLFFNDILDVIGNTEKLGKKVLSDEENDKTNFISMHGLDYCIKECERLTNESINILDSLSVNTEALKILTKELLDREN